MIKKNEAKWHKGICSSCKAKFECRNPDCNIDDWNEKRKDEVVCWCQECSKSMSVRCEYKNQKEVVSFT